MCEFLQARVQWISSFDGGDPQNFTVIILNSLDGKSVSYGFHDEGENKTHVAFVSNLQPSVTYWFYVTAKNSHGSSISEITSCKTVEGNIQLYFSGEVNYNIQLFVYFFSEVNYNYIVHCYRWWASETVIFFIVII